MTWKAVLSIQIREVSVWELNERKFLHGCTSLGQFSGESPFFSYPRRKDGSRRPSFPNEKAYSGFPYHHLRLSSMSVYYIKFYKKTLTNIHLFILKYNIAFLYIINLRPNLSPCGVYHEKKFEKVPI